MGTCEVCGNRYEKAFSAKMCRLIGHGVEANGKTFCCEHCAHA